MSQLSQYCTFFLAGHCFGVEVERVQEIIRYQKMTRVPLSARAVRGLINLRGQIVTAIDLRRRMELSERTDDRPPMNVVIKTGESATSLLVDEIGDVIEVDQSIYESCPDTLKGLGRELIKGAYKLDDRLLLLLDIDKATTVEN